VKRCKNPTMDKVYYKKIVIPLFSEEKESSLSKSNNFSETQIMSFKNSTNKN
jgi:hypothetical protein